MGKLIILFFLAVSSLAQAELCEIQPLTGTPVAGRSGRIVFPDGRSLIVIGHYHGSRSVLLHAWNMTLAPEFVLDGLWKEIFLSLLEDQKAVDHNREDIGFLASIKTQFPEIKFIGIETTPSEAQIMMQNYPSYFSKIWHKAGEFDVPVEDRNQVLSLGAGAAVFMKIMNPKDLEGIPLIGLERTDAYDRQEEIYAGWRASREKLAARKLIDSVLPSYLEGVVEQLLNREEDNEIFQNTVYRDQFLASATSHLSGADLNLARDVLTADFDLAAFNDERDTFVAKALTEKTSSGVHITGLAHSKNILLKLKKACQTQARQKPDSLSGRR